MKKAGLVELNAVVAVAAHNNFRAAAMELGMSPSALSHAIASLESRMGVRLFHRTTRSVSVSEAGREFLARVQPALHEIAEALEIAGEHRPTPAGTLRVNSSEAAAEQLMSAYVYEFVQRYPDMRVEVVTEGRMVDIVADGFDAGIRLADVIPQDMVAIRFGPHQSFAVVGSPGYFKEHKRPRAPHDLASHRCIRNKLASGVIWRWEFEKRDEEIAIDVDGPLTLDNNVLRLGAALNGAGLVYMNEWSARPHIEGGRLIRVLQDWTPPHGQLALYYSGHRHLPAGLRALIDLIHDMEPAPTKARDVQGKIRD
jgi:DNA-binding transcriptional LysR family regulator